MKISHFSPLYFFQEMCYTYNMEGLLKTTGAYQLLKKEGEGEGFSHAYLLLFEDARYLREGARTFAKLFFHCDEPTSATKKRIAELIDSESFADCLFYPTENKKLTVEDAEKIIEECNLAPVEGDKKLFVLADFAEANAQTQNKLLKILEEPPKGVYFLLGATSAFPLLQTVLSRAKALEILPFTEREVEDFLARKYPSFNRQVLAACAATSGGVVGDACSLLEGEDYANLVNGAFSLLISPLHQLPAIVKNLAETPRKKELLNLLRLICRDALLLKLGQSNLLLRGEIERLQTVASGYSKAALLFAQEAISNAEKQVKFNAIFSQCLQTCVANIIAKNKETL